MLLEALSLVADVEPLVIPLAAISALQYERILDTAPRTSCRILRVMFVHTDMRIGGAEMITASVIRGLDRTRFAPEVCCLKERGALGEQLADEVPVHAGLLRNKYDLRVWPRLTRLLRRRQTDVVITVGAGDKMFWGRLAARRARVPVIMSALHSTGWPDGVGRLNRLLMPLTDAFIAVADAHGRYLVEHEDFPVTKVAVIPNGVDTERFAPESASHVATIRRELGIDRDAPVVGIVAALRPEKNHELFLELARRTASQLPRSQFLIIGDGPCRASLEQCAARLAVQNNVRFLGMRNDIPRLLAALDVFVLTSHNEANPVSVLEAMSTGKPVVATKVGSVHEAVADGKTGFLVPAGDAKTLVDRTLQLLNDPRLAQSMGAAGRATVAARWSIHEMVSRYAGLIESVYCRKEAVASGWSEE